MEIIIEILISLVRCEYKTPEILQQGVKMITSLVC